jgi:hypothetical protein
MGGAKNRNKKSTLTIGDLASRCELSNITEGKNPKTILGIQTSCARSKLFDEICRLLSGDEEQGRITGPFAHGVVGTVVTTTDSTRGIKILPKSSPS